MDAEEDLEELEEVEEDEEELGEGEEGDGEDPVEDLDDIQVRYTHNVTFGNFWPGIEEKWRIQCLSDILTILTTI